MTQTTAQHKPVTKAVIAAAGFGTRMLPMTKTISKEVLPLVDKPIIQYVVEELAGAGISDIIIVTSQRKADLVDYFSDVDAGLLEHLKASDKHDYIRKLEDIHKLANIAFIEQRGPYGTGTPVLNAEPYLGNEPFLYTYADDFFVAPENSFAQMIKVYEQYGTPVLGCLRCDKDEDYDRYGNVGGTEIAPGLIDMKSLIEKPGKANALSNLASLGFYLATPEVLPYLHQLRERLQDGQELYWNYSFNLMVEDGKQVLAKEIVGGAYYDTGNKLEYMKTAVAMAARHPEIGDEFRQHLKENYS